MKTYTSTNIINIEAVFDIVAFEKDYDKNGTDIVPSYTTASETLGTLRC